MRFRLWTILWVFATFSSAMATFSPSLGLVIATSICFFWSILFYRPKRGMTLAELLVFIAVTGTLAGLFLPPEGHDRRGTIRNICVTTMEDIGTAVLHYRNRHGTPPEDFITTSGKQLSWRVLIAPDVGEADLCLKYGLDKNWDGKNEKQLFSEFPFSFACLSRNANDTIRNN